MNRMTQEELNGVLELHKKWLNDEKGGVRADLSGANLEHTDLYHADLRLANLSQVNLYSANLFEADLRDADLSQANLVYAYLGNANLKEANLMKANLYKAKLTNADLSLANLRGSDLSKANFEGANLMYTELDDEEQFRKGIILKKPMIGYKKCRDGITVTLEIPKGAIVFSINNIKCRTNKAKVIEISDNYKTAVSTFDGKFIYQLGKELEIKDFNLQYNVECAEGIHFFKTKEEAKRY